MKIPGISAPLGGVGGSLSLVATLLLATAARAQDRAVIENRSAQPWTLALVEGLKPQSGTLTIKDRASSVVLGTLTRPGESLLLPPKGSFMAIFERKGGYLYQNLIFKDIKGHCAEFLAYIEYLSSPKITIQLVRQHVGPPLDSADEETVKQFINDCIETGSDNIIIYRNTMDYR